MLRFIQFKKLNEQKINDKDEEVIYAINIAIDARLEKIKKSKKEEIDNLKTNNISIDINDIIEDIKTKLKKETKETWNVIKNAHLISNIPAGEYFSKNYPIFLKSNIIKKTKELLSESDKSLIKKLYKNKNKFILDIENNIPYNALEIHDTIAGAALKKADHKYQENIIIWQKNAASAINDSIKRNTKKSIALGISNLIW